jgi:hypothetical protein
MRRTYFLGKATTPQGPLVYSNSGLESPVQKPLNGRQTPGKLTLLLALRNRMLFVPLSD